MKQEFQMQNSKVVSEREQAKRGARSMGFFAVLGFAMIMTFPLLNAIVGMFMFLALAMKIYATSAQRAADFGWLVLGAIICLFGFFLPALLDGPTSTGMIMGFTLDFLLNIFVAIFFLGGRLRHLFVGKPATA
jgi:hypothetical protein